MDKHYINAQKIQQPMKKSGIIFLSQPRKLDFDWKQLTIENSSANNDVPHPLHLVEIVKDEQKKIIFARNIVPSSDTIYKQLPFGEFGGTVDDKGNGKGYLIRFEEEVHEYLQVQVRKWLILLPGCMEIQQQPNDLQTMCDKLYQQYLGKQKKHRIVFFNKKNTKFIKSKEQWERLFAQYQGKSLVMLTGLEEFPEINLILLRLNGINYLLQDQLTSIVIKGALKPFAIKSLVKQFTAAIPGITRCKSMAGLNHGYSVILILKILFEQNLIEEKIMTDLVSDCYLPERKTKKLLTKDLSLLTTVQLRRSKDFSNLMIRRL